MFLAGDANQSSSMVSIARSYDSSRLSLDDRANEIKRTNLDSVIFIQNSANEVPSDLDSSFFIVEHAVEHL